jgi:hypothetical protein
VKQARLNREKRTLQVMIELYCRGHHHQADGLCAACEQLFDYAMQRINKCPYQADKPTCAQCPIHCYKPDMRQQVRQVMRYSGPRMLIYHPVLTLRHYLDELTQTRQANPINCKER